MCSVTQYKDRKYLNSIDIAGRIVGSLATSQILTHKAPDHFFHHTHIERTQNKNMVQQEKINNDQ